MTRSTFSTTPLTRAASALSTVLRTPLHRLLRSSWTRGQRRLRESMGSLRQKAGVALFIYGSATAMVRARRVKGQHRTWAREETAGDGRSFAERRADDLRAERRSHEAPLRGVFHDHRHDDRRRFGRGEADEPAVGRLPGARLGGSRLARAVPAGAPRARGDSAPPRP